MDRRRTFSPLDSLYSDQNLGWNGWPRAYNTFPSTFTDSRPWDTYSSLSNAHSYFPNSHPLDASAYPYSGNFADQPHLPSGPNLDPAILWSRGISSPCFCHDHHLIIRNGTPPFSAGDWEIDGRHMIEVQFDHFGVASHCRSTWGRIGPWRADRHRFGVGDAYSKLRLEVMMLMSRLGIVLHNHLQNADRRFDAFFPPPVRDNGYDRAINHLR